MAPSATVHRFQEIKQITSAAISQTAPTHLDVTQSQLSAWEPLDIEQPHGLDAMTKTENRAASSARAANARAMRLVVRSVPVRTRAI